MKKRIIAAIAVVAMVGAGSADVLFESNFDGHTGVPTSGYVQNVSGSTTAGVTWDTQDASVTSISGLTAISPGGGFVNQGSTFASGNNIYVNHNLNIADRANPRGYSLTFTTDSSLNLTNLTVRAGHSNNTGSQNQAFASDLTIVLSEATQGTIVTDTAIQVDYTGVEYVDTGFDLTGTHIAAGTYTLSVSENNMGGGGAYAIFDGIVLNGFTGPPPPAITEFGASSTNVFAGATATLSWSTLYADSLSLNQGIGDVTGTNSVDVTVTSDTIYTLTAINGIGTVTESVEITLITTPPEINSFEASSTNVFADETITLSWEVDGAAGLSISGIGDVTGLTSTQVVVSADTTYTLTATSPHGSSIDEVTVNLKTTPPEINSFSSSHPFVLSGDTVTLSWNVEGATGISIDPGVGDVTGTNQVDVVVTAETMYTLTATNGNGPTNTSVTVSVVELSDSTVININFDDGIRPIDGPLGAVISTNWNLADIGAAGSPVTTSNLLLSTGAESTADLELSNRTIANPGGWSGNGVVSGAAGDMAQLFHYRNRNNGAIATVSELPFETYDVYVYFNRAIGAGEPFVVSLGGTSQTVTPSGDASEFVEAKSGNSYIGNYFVFKEITGSSFTLTVGDDASPTVAEYAFGMQIVNIGNVPDGPVTVTIAGPVSAGTGMEISWFGKKDALYGVETNSNLIIESGWQQFGPDVTGSDGTITVTNTIGPDQTFYRVISK